MFRPIVLTVDADSACPGIERHGEPVAIGIACPRGAVARPAYWTLTDQRGQPTAVQTTTLDRWSDGSVRWLLVEFQADVVAQGPSCFALAPGDTDAPVEGRIAIERAGEVLRVTTGAATIDVARHGSSFLRSATVNGDALLRSTSVTAEDDRDASYRLRIDRTLVERAGPLRAVIRVDGALAGDGPSAWLEASIRLHFFAGLGTVKVELSVANPRASSVLIRELSIALSSTAASASDVWGSIDHIDPMQPAGSRFAVYQDSSAGLRATPIASLGGGPTRISVAVPRFWELFPKALEATRQQCVIGMFPRQYRDYHELHGGERSTLAWATCFGRDTVTAEPLAWIRSPLHVSAAARSYRDARVWAPLTALSDDTTEPDAIRQRQEAGNEYGWRHFGDLDAHDQGASLPHANHDDDALTGYITRFLRTGDQRWWQLADALAGHVLDIELEAASQPTTGLMLHYFLTGSERARAAVIQLANVVVDTHHERSAATMPLQALLDAHRLTGEPRFLAKAQWLISRSSEQPEPYARVRQRAVEAMDGAART
jgi:hypothetical protein